MELKSVEDITSWLREHETLVSTALEQRNSLAELRAAKAIGERLKNQKSVVATENNMRLIEQTHKSVEELVRERLRVTTAEQGAQLLTDVRVRLSRAQDLFVTWRQTLAVVEFLGQVGQLVEVATEPNQITKADAEKSVKQAQERYEVQLELLRSLIPEPSMLFLPVVEA